MKEVTIKIYQFNELSDSAKETARDWYREDGLNNEHIYKEAFDSLNAFKDIFDIETHGFSMDEMYRSSWTFNLDDTILELKGQRLATYIWNNYRSQIFKGKYYGKLVKTFKDGSPIPVSKEHPAGLRHVRRYSKCTLEHCCVLTGVCYDDSILDPIYKFLDKPVADKDFEELLEECLYAIAKDVQNEVEARNEDDCVDDEIMANEYEFTEDGERY